MYSNVGKKIQIIGQVLGWLLLIAGFIYCCYCISSSWSGDDLIGWVSLIVGVIGFMSTWFIYAFGQLVDDVHAIRSDKESPAVPNDELPEL